MIVIGGTDGGSVGVFSNFELFSKKVDVVKVVMITVVIVMVLIMVISVVLDFLIGVAMELVVGYLGSFRVIPDQLQSL